MSDEKNCPSCQTVMEGDTCSTCASYPETVVKDKDSETPVPWSKRKRVMDLLFQKTGESLEEEISDYVEIPEEVRDALGKPDRRLNQYVLLEKVGEGGMGTVWKGWDLDLARPVAVKFLHSTEERAIGRFVREAQLSAQLRHANIAGIHEVKQSEEKPYLVMDYIEGENLRAQQLPLRKALDVFAKACRAVQFAHDRSIIHRDIKPANIMLGKDGEPYVTDFGLAKILRSESSISASGTVMGSPVYMSPEQAMGKTREVDALSDLYSLGATLYTMLAGQTPFEEGSLTQVLQQVANEEPFPLRQVKREVPAPVEAIVTKAMAKAKIDRYPTAGALAEDVESYLRDETVSARTPGTFTRSYRRFQKNPWPVMTMTTIVLSLLVVGGVLLYPTFVDEPKEVSFPKEFFFGAFEADRPKIIEEAKRVFREIPDADAIAWMEKEASEIPKVLWAKGEWLQQKSEAVRIRQWCGVLLEIIDSKGDAFSEVRSQLQDARNRFLPVVDYQGTATVRIYITPYAMIQTLSVGDRLMVKGGKKVDALFPLDEEDLSTPLLLGPIEIGDISLEVAHPKYGVHTIRVPEEKLENGKEYLISGSLDQPNSIELRLP